VCNCTVPSLRCDGFTHTHRVLFAQLEMAFQGLEMYCWQCLIVRPIDIRSRFAKLGIIFHRRPVPWLFISLPKECALTVYGAYTIHALLACMNFVLSWRRNVLPVVLICAMSLQDLSQSAWRAGYTDRSKLTELIMCHLRDCYCLQGVDAMDSHQRMMWNLESHLCNLSQSIFQL